VGAVTAPTSSDRQTLVDVRDLCTYFRSDEGVAKAVDGVSVRIPAGRTLGLVGESGCGKTVTALSVMRLVPSPPGRIERGEIFFEGHDLLKLPETAMRRIRGNDISMIFQEPMTSLNPVFTCGNQITEVLQLHQGLGKRAALERAIEMLDKVGIPSPAQRVHEYPHQLSGGMKQRVMIAMALACNPKHPYMQGLFGSLAKLGAKGGRLNVIPGVVPNPIEFPSGCKFHPRCPHAFDRCRVDEPELRVVGPGGHVAACHLYPEGGSGQASQGGAS